jgi:hypothetical protein
MSPSSSASEDDRKAQAKNVWMRDLSLRYLYATVTQCVASSLSRKLKDKAASSFLLRDPKLAMDLHCKHPAQYLQQARGKKVGRKACE